MAQDRITIEVALDLSPQATAELQKKIAELDLRKKNIELGVDTKEGVAAIEQLEKEIDAITKGAKQVPLEVKADTKELDSVATALQNIESNIANVGARSMEIQGLRDRLINLRAETLTFNTVLAATATGFDILGKTNFKGILKDFKDIGGAVKLAGTYAKQTGKDLKAAFNAGSLKGFVGGLKQIPTAMKSAAGGAKAFGVALKSALGTVQLVISGIQGVAALVSAIAGEDFLKDALSKLPKFMQGVASQLLGVALDEPVAKLSKRTKELEAELRALNTSGQKITAERAKQLQAELTQLENLQSNYAIDINNGETLSQAEKDRNTDLQVREGYLNQILGKQEEEKEVVEKTKIAYSDINSVLKEQEKSLATLRAATLKLQKGLEGASDIEILDSDTSAAIEGIDRAYTEEVEAINKLILKRSDAANKQEALDNAKARRDELALQATLSQRNQIQKMIDASPLATKKSELQASLVEVERYFDLQIALKKATDGQISEADEQAIRAQMQKRMELVQKEYFDKMRELSEKNIEQNEAQILGIISNNANAVEGNYVKVTALAKQELGILRETVAKADLTKTVELKLKISNAAEALQQAQKQRDKLMAVLSGDIEATERGLKEAELKSINKNIGILETEVKQAEGAFDSFRDSVNKGKSSLNMFVMQGLQGLSEFAKNLDFVSNKKVFDSANYDTQMAELKRQLNANLITYEEYYDEIERLKIEKDAEMRAIDAENAEASNTALFANLASLAEGFNGILTAHLEDSIAKFNANQDDMEARGTATSAVLAAGLGNAFQGIFSDMEKGQLTVASLFTNMLKGALSVLPALLTVEGIMSPWKLIAVGVGVTALIALINSLTKKQKSEGYAEGGLVLGERGVDKIPARLTHGEFVVPADKVRNNLNNLENLRRTGQWNNAGFTNYTVIASKLDTLNSTIKNTERNVRLQGSVKVNNKYFSDVEWKRLRMAF